MTSTNPLDDLRNLFGQLPDIDAASVKKVYVETPYLSQASSRDDISSLVGWLAGWQANSSPTLAETHICVLVSTYESAGGISDALDFIEKASKGLTPVNQLCKERGVGLRVLEMAPTVPHLVGQSWSEAECMAATAFGMEAAAAGGDLLGLTSFAPGSDSVCMALIENIQKASSLDGVGDALEIMRAYGGREVAGLVGSILAARSRRLPVLIEGWSAIAAMYIVCTIEPAAIDHVQVASVSNKQQLDIALELNKAPIVGQYINIGAGSGLAIAASSLGSLLNLAKQ